MIFIGACGLVLLLFIGLLLIDESEEREVLKLVEIEEKLLKDAEKKSCEGCKHKDEGERTT